VVEFKTFIGTYIGTYIGGMIVETMFNLTTPTICVMDNHSRHSACDVHLLFWNWMNHLCFYKHKAIIPLEAWFIKWLSSTRRYSSSPANVYFALMGILFVFEKKNPVKHLVKYWRWCLWNVMLLIFCWIHTIRIRIELRSLRSFIIRVVLYR
jgi:hypothetical protein